ncbi:MAG: YbaN family protein [Arcanobacterium sp.]
MKKLISGLCNLVGILAVALGIAGMTLPVLPTVPFFLLAAACFMRGSQRLYRWLMTHPKYGLYVYQYREAKAMTRRSKAIAIGTMWAGMLFSIWIIPLLHAQIFLAVVLVSVTIYLLSFDELKEDDLTDAQDSYDDFVRTEFGFASVAPATSASAN